VLRKRYLCLKQGHGNQRVHVWVTRRTRVSKKVVAWAPQRNPHTVRSPMDGEVVVGNVGEYNHSSRSTDQSKGSPRAQRGAKDAKGGERGPKAAPHGTHVRAMPEDRPTNIMSSSTVTHVGVPDKPRVSPPVTVQVRVSRADSYPSINTGTTAGSR
jgi:hypothetical protein